MNKSEEEIEVFDILPYLDDNEWDYIQRIYDRKSYYESFSAFGSHSWLFSNRDSKYEIKKRKSNTNYEKKFTRDKVIQELIDDGVTFKYENDFNHHTIEIKRKAPDQDETFLEHIEHLKALYVLEPFNLYLGENLHLTFLVYDSKEEAERYREILIEEKEKLNLTEESINTAILHSSDIPEGVLNYIGKERFYFNSFVIPKRQLKGLASKKFYQWSSEDAIDPLSEEEFTFLKDEGVIDELKFMFHFKKNGKTYKVIQIINKIPKISPDSIRIIKSIIQDFSIISTRKHK